MWSFSGAPTLKGNLLLIVFVIYVPIFKWQFKLVMELLREKYVYRIEN